MIRVILDANIYISALLKPQGVQSELLIRGVQGEFELVLSESIFLELCRVLQYDKIIKRLTHSKNQIKKFLEHLTTIASWTNDEIDVKICEDPKDDIYLACAKESQAEFLVSGDDHLLKLKKFEETEIVTTQWMLKYIRESVQSIRE